MEASPEEICASLLAIDLESINTYNPEELCETIDTLADVWCVDAEVDYLMRRNAIFFGERQSLQPRYHFYSKTLGLLRVRLAGMTEEQVPREVSLAKLEVLTRMMVNVQHGFESMVHLYTQVYTNKPELRASLPTITFDSFFVPVVEEDMAANQKLILYYLQECQRHGLRKQKTALMEPKFTPEGNFTHTYVYKCDIDFFIYAAIYPYEQHVSLFRALTAKGSTAKQAADHLEKCKDDRLPSLNKDRTKFAFRDGIFDAKGNRFYPYGQLPAHMRDVVCAHYMDVCIAEHCADDMLPENIFTPNVQKILDSQDFPPEVCFWFFASIGRMVFDINSMDQWQFFVFCKGTAGSGKSTLLRLASMFYDAVDVGNLMNEGQTTFSTEHIVDTFVFFCYDVDSNMNFSLTRWNQMVSGEMIAVERKYKLAVQRMWKSCGAFAGNSYPPWVDVAGNVARRMLPFLFLKTVRQVDPKLFDKCMLEIGAFLVKCVGCYHALRLRFGDHGIWDTGVLPPYFHQARKMMQGETNPVHAFLQSECCKIADSETTGLAQFRAAFNSFCDTQKYRKSRLTPDALSPVLEPLGARLVTVSPRDNPADFHGFSSDYLLGVKLL